MPTGATSHDDDATGRNQLLTEVNDGRKCNLVSVCIDAPSHAVTQAIGLLEDLLEHEERIATLLQLSQCDVYLLHFGMLRHIIQVNHMQLLASLQHSDVPIVQINHLIGVFGNGTGIRSQVEIVLSIEANHKRRALAGTDDGIWMHAVNYGDGIGTYHLMQRYLHGFQQSYVVARHDIFDELNEHFCICSTLEGDAPTGQLLFQRQVVFNDAIVYEGQSARGRIMRVRIDAGRLSVGSPAGMRYAHAARDILAHAIGFKVGHLALGLIHIQIPLRIDECQACAVVPSVLQSLKPFD